MPGSRSPRAVLLAALALAGSAATLAAGCGSSGSSATSAPPSTSAATAAASVGTSSTKSGSSLKVSTVPQYGTPSASAPVLGGTVQIAYRNITIQPDVVRVKVGTTLRWTNYDTVEHNVTGKSGPQRFASHDISEGQSFQVTLTKPGIYHYQCTIHPTTMNATIEVVR